MPQVEGVKVYTGGEELRRAAAALSGPSLAPKSSSTLPLPTQQARYPLQGLSAYAVCLTSASAKHGLAS